MHYSQLDRRSFIKQVAISTGSVMLAGAGSQSIAQINPNWKNHIGLELFTVRDLLRKDYEGTLAKLAGIGYKEVEPADPYNGMSPEGYKALLDKNHLKMFSTHSGAAEGPDLEKQLEGFQLMGIKYTEVRGPRGPGGRGRGPGGSGGPGGPGGPPPGGPGAPAGAAGAATPGGPALGDRAGGPPPAGGGPGAPSGPGVPGERRGPGRGGPRPPQTVEAVKQSCAQMNQHGAIVKKFGMKILIHNHAGEFDLLADGKTTQYDVMLAETDPELVAMQLDIGWAYIAGQDALQMFKKNPGRYELWHVKDAKYKELDPTLTPSQRQRAGKIVTMGEGDIDYKTIFANAGLAGLKYFVIEQDTAGQGGRDAIEDCRIAYENLSKILA
jgi:sugar phosphate isomerase/epimerase